jgi:hypothetical protein
MNSSGMTALVQRFISGGFRKALDERRQSFRGHLPRPHIERSNSKGWADVLLQLLQEYMSFSCRHLAAMPFLPTTSCHTQASWQPFGTRINFYHN